MNHAKSERAHISAVVAPFLRERMEKIIKTDTELKTNLSEVQEAILTAFFYINPPPQDVVIIKRLVKQLRKGDFGNKTND